MSGSKYRKKLRRLIKSCKRKPCKDCGGRLTPREMSYDHIRGVKEFCLGDSINGYTEVEVRREISKCDVVCIYCHRERESDRAKERFLVG